MKLELTTYEKKISFETENDDVLIDSYFDAFKGLLVASGWSETTINDYIIELAEEIKE